MLSRRWNGKILLLLCVLALLLPACGQAPTGLPATTAPSATQAGLPAGTSAGTATITPSPDTLHTRAAAFDQTATIRALTPSPSATSEPGDLPPTPRPTTTPTFDPRSQPTFTPAPAAACPQVDSQAASPVDFILDGVFTVPEDKLLAYLNAYGPQPLQAFLQGFMGPDAKALQASDLTNDGIDELVFRYGWSFYIIDCQDGQYQTTLRFEPDGLSAAHLMNVVDANRNGMPEITLLVYAGTQGGATYQILEWDGANYQDVIDQITPDSDGAPSVVLDVNAHGSIDTEDINQDGVLEYRVDVGTAVWDSYRFGIPWREEIQYFRWNGSHFVFERSIFSPPEFRFQAVQDGDRATMERNYDQAMELYQQAIFSDQLEWWTPARYDQILDAYWAVTGLQPSPTPTLPAPDPLEYDHLAAYARFKIMVLHAARGWESDAKNVYDTLLAKYPDGKPGRIHAQMAQVFWEDYSQSKDAVKACQAALAFANEHKREVTRYLTAAGSMYQRDLDYSTQLEAICPIQ